MAGEIEAIDEPGQVVYAVILGSGSTAWSVTGGAFVPILTGARPNHAVPMPESPLGGLYVGDFPPAIPSGIYTIVAYRRLGATPADDDLPIAQLANFSWSAGVLTGPTPGRDPLFERGFNATVAAWVDVNASGTTRTARGVVQPIWQVVSGLEAVRCMIDPLGARTSADEDKPRVVANALVLFSGRVSLDARHKLVVASPPIGAVPEWFVDGYGIDEATSGHHTAVRCTDVKL